jgi:hypothetical protein
MQRRVDQADDYRIAVHCFEQTVKILALVGEQLIERLIAFLTGSGQNHALNDRQALGFKEHVLSAAETDTNGAVRARALCILRVICIRPNLQTASRIALSFRFTDIFLRANIISPLEQSQ